MIEGDWVRAGLVLLLSGLLLSAGAEDARTREIADGKSIAICLAAPLWWWANGASPWPGAALQAGLACGCFLLFALAFRFGMMGGGDVKLVAALSLWLPPAVLITMLVAMALIGALVTIVMLIDHRLRRPSGELEVPYGVAIAAAGLLVINEPILNQFG